MDKKNYHRSVVGFSSIAGYNVSLLERAPTIKMYSFSHLSSSKSLYLVSWVFLIIKFKMKNGLDHCDRRGSDIIVLHYCLLPAAFLEFAVWGNLT